MTSDKYLAEVWVGEATDPYSGSSLGECFIKVHDSNKCAGQHCVIHNPSDHHMRTWPTVWRADIGIMERTCPHGVGHPDPDDTAYQTSIGNSSAGVHGCDGCCHA